MDKRAERAAVERVRRRVARGLQVLGYRRTKTTFFTRSRPFWIEFIHLHKYSFAPGFRVHLGLRVLNAPGPIEAAALNGPDSHSAGWFELDFVPPHSVEECAQEIVRFCEEVGELWFQHWGDPGNLIWSGDSPLFPEERYALDRAIQGRINQDRVSNAYTILGIRTES